MEIPADLLRKGLRELGISFTEHQTEAFLFYLEELKRWNKAYNLTGLKTDREIIIKHFFDSLLFLKALPEHVRSLADIGSGAGFPGIPLKIMYPDPVVYLVEPSKKKAAFLRHVCKQLRLPDVEIIDRRIEEVTDLKVDAAVTRALFSIDDFLKKTQGIVKKKGVLILSKGPKLAEELQGVPSDRISTLDVKLPLLNIIRHLVVIQA